MCPVSLYPAFQEKKHVLKSANRAHSIGKLNCIFQKNLSSGNIKPHKNLVVSPRIFSKNWCGYNNFKKLFTLLDIIKYECNKI